MTVRASGIRKMYCELYCIRKCTVQNEPSDELFKIKKSDNLFNTKSKSPSTGNASSKSNFNNYCYMAEEVHVNLTKIPQSRNLTPVTIMVADTIGTVKSRRLLKVLLTLVQQQP